MKKPPLVTLIISNLNGMDLNILPNCLSSLIKPDYPNWELIVIDSNSSDNSVSYIENRFKNKPNCRLVKNPVRMYSQGLNLGAQYAKGEYLAYFNNDVALKTGYFQELLKQFNKDNKLGIVQGKLLNYFDRSKIDSAGETMDVYGNPITIGAGETDHGQYDKEEEILSASGSACVIKKSVFKKVGGYDPEYCIGYEDMDISLKVRSMGYKVKRFPKAIIYHKRASTDLAAFVRIQNKWHFNKNRIATMIKNYPIILLLKSLPITILLYISIGTWECFINRNWKIGLTRFTSIGWIISNFTGILKKRAHVKRNTLKSYTIPLRLFSDKSIVSIFKDFVKFNK